MSSAQSVLVIRQLGLAAYLMSNGATFIGMDGRNFRFSTDIPFEEWRTRYANSCCSRHDAAVCSLRQFLVSER